MNERARIIFLLVGLALGLALSSGPAAADNTANMGWPRWYIGALGEPTIRARVYLDGGFPHDNVATDGGALTAYTFGGGEHVCVQSSIDFCFEVDKYAADMTASCGKAVRVPADTERCFFLRSDSGVISFLPLQTATGVVNIFETRL